MVRRHSVSVYFVTMLRIAANWKIFCFAKICPGVCLTRILAHSLRECSGGDEGDRTPDLVHAKHALSQLSYTPICLIYNTPFLSVCQLFLYKKDGSLSRPLIVLVLRIFCNKRVIFRLCNRYNRSMTVFCIESEIIRSHEITCRYIVRYERLIAFTL